jgi:hypothetical protein
MAKTSLALAQLTLARLLHPAGNGLPSQVAAHDQPIRCVRFVQIPGSNIEMIVTGS